jgi:hypothetical protein
MWNRLGFHVIDKLLDDVTMNANYFTKNILALLKKNYSPIEGWRMEGDLSCTWTMLPFTIMGWQQVSLQITIWRDSSTRHTRRISLRATFAYFRQ